MTVAQRQRFAVLILVSHAACNSQKLVVTNWFE